MKSVPNEHMPYTSGINKNCEKTYWGPRLRCEERPVLLDVEYWMFVV